MKRLLMLALLIAAPGLAQDTKISALPDGSPGQATDAIPIARAGANYRLPFSAFALLGSPLNLSYIAEPDPLTATVNVTAGNLNGTYSYRVTFVTALGETNSCVTRDGLTGNCKSAPVSPVNQQVDLSAIPVSPSSLVTARNIYRTAGDNGYFIDMRLVATIGDNVTTTLTDNVADAGRGVYMPWMNSTGGYIKRDAFVMAAADETYTVFGYHAMPGVLGYDNFAFGPYALRDNTYGHDNGAVGPDALRHNTTGNYNVAVGESALYINTTGSENSAIGMNALRHNNTGSKNTAVGASALYGATPTGSTYDNNTAVGVQALYSVTTATSNTGVGFMALKTLSSGQFNAALGHNACYTIAATSNNTCIGEGALALATGSANIALGFRAGYYETGSNKLFIDGIDRATEAGGRTLSLIYGVMGAAVKNQTLTINAFTSLSGIAFADLGTPANGTLAYCSDCLIQASCAGSGTGALAKRLNGAWVCN